MRTKSKVEDMKNLRERERERERLFKMGEAKALAKRCDFQNAGFQIMFMDRYMCVVVGWFDVLFLR